LYQYSDGTLPKSDRNMMETLENAMIAQTDIERTRALLQTSQSNDADLVFDIKSRRHHLENVVSQLQSYIGAKKVDEVVMEAEDMINRLTEILRNHEHHPHIHLANDYRQLMSSSRTNNRFGYAYCLLFERLLARNVAAELHELFLNATRLSEKWLKQHGVGDEFEPKVLLLFQAIQDDLVRLYKDTASRPRSKIGVIGYTNAGKSSLVCRSLGVKSLDESNAPPVRSVKSTHQVLRYNRTEPLAHPRNRTVKVPVTFIDIAGLDKNQQGVHDEEQVNRYLDLIHRADCDVYLLVFDDKLHREQQQWIDYIESTLRRKCLLVRSQVDGAYLRRFRELARKTYGQSTDEQRKDLHSQIIEHIHREHEVKERQVYLTAAGYEPESMDAAMLMENTSFDLADLLDIVAEIAFDASHRRIQKLAFQVVARSINTCLRRGYVINAVKFKIAAGVASVIPFLDQLPRYRARKALREAFGIDDGLHAYLTTLGLQIDNPTLLQTSVFEKLAVAKSASETDSIPRGIGAVARPAVVAVVPFIDDIARLAIPAVSAASKVALTVATVGVGIVLSVGLGAWSGVSCGQHIISYNNRLCDDLIIVGDTLIASIVKSESIKSNETLTQ
jgi:predicted GTPase